MPDQSMVFQKVLLAPEGSAWATTPVLAPGVPIVPADAAAAAAAYRKFLAVNIEPTMVIEKSPPFKPRGYLVPTTQSTIGLGSTLSMNSDSPSYQEVPLVASSALHFVADHAAATVTYNDGYKAAQDGGAGPTYAYAWVFDPKGSAIQSPLTFTTMTGDLDTFHRVAYSIFNSLSFTVATGGGVTMSGSGFGRRFENNTDDDAPMGAGAALTNLRDHTIGNDAGATPIPGINEPPVTINSVCADVYIADTFEHLHDTAAATFTDASWVAPVYPLDPTARLGRVSSFEWAINDRWGQFKELSCALKGAMAFHTTTAPNGTVSFTTSAAGDPFIGDGTNPHKVAAWDGLPGMHLVNLIRNNNQVWVCCHVTSDQLAIVTGQPYELRLYACVLLSNATIQEDQSLKGLRVEGTMSIAPTEASGRPDFARLVVINNSATLLG